MKSEKEIREKLEYLKSRHQEYVRESGDKPCKPDGSEDTKHIAAVSVYGSLSELEWVLEDE